MTRDLALKQAISYAKANKSVAVVWCYSEPNSWTWADYEAMDLYQASPDSIRYVLPHSEVTKLS